MDRNTIIQNITTNLEKDRISKNYSQAAWAEIIGMSLSSYKRLISGASTKIDILTIFKIYELTGKTLLELAEQRNEVINTVLKLNYLSTQQLKFINYIIDFERNFLSSISKDEIDDYLSVMVPTGDMHDGMIYDSANVEKVNIKSYRSRLNKEINFGVKITSNHLHPVYNLDDILLVSQCPIRDGDIGIFFNRTNQRIYIRKYYQTYPCKLEPINNYGQTFYVDPNNKSDMDQWTKIGKVIVKIRL
ncbi:MAG: helix-turn-helix transcriptional regulator [Lachnospiraceae bacterium]|nr:helix-turn-helix transcriptional regulator [Lachnospiraceae bacterium]MEE1101403.1 helix-turn-helix transcriptional regulator [Agathobacter sp.]